MKPTQNAAFDEKMLNHFAKVTMRQVKAGTGVELNWQRIVHDQKWGKNDGGWLVFSTIQNFLKIGELIAVPEYDEKGEEKRSTPGSGRYPMRLDYPMNKLGKKLGDWGDCFVPHPLQTLNGEFPTPRFPPGGIRRKSLITLLHNDKRERIRGKGKYISLFSKVSVLCFL